MREAVACEKGRRKPFCLCALGLPSAEQISMATGAFRGKSSGGPHGHPEAKPLTETRPLQSPRIALAHYRTLERSLGLTTSFPTLPFSPKAKPLTDTFALANSKTRARDGRTTGASLAPSRLRRPPFRSTMSGQADN